MERKREARLNLMSRSYIQKWTFYLDGTIEPTFAFTAVQNGCVSKAHYHNAYWRFDFDVDGFPQDVLDRFLFFIFWAGRDTVGTELSQPRNPFVGYVWRVRDKITGRGYIIAPGPEDGIADGFGVADAWDLAYHGNEIDRRSDGQRRTYGQLQEQ